ncbi:MAG: cell division protein CrgA [Actinomycetota bacterium]|nr:cell division protein CrgA [Actinomycetota bacterium]
MPVSKKRKKVASHRPTPPKRVDPVQSKGPSPTWYVAVMFGLMGLGTLLILANYVTLLPNSPDNSWLLIGLAGIAGGFGMTLNYR